MILVKIGGSVLTNKGTRGRPRFNRVAAQRLVRELAAIAAKDPVVLVHGAGSFAHPLAVHYAIGKRRLSGNRLHVAVTRTRAGVQALRAHVLDACLRARLPALDIPATPLASGQRGTFRLDATPFQRALDAGFMPVTGGDVVLDERVGARILSGDEILHHLARQLTPRRVVFVSDVDGVRLNGRTLGTLTVDEARALLPKLAVGKDATGGMRGKVAQALEIAALGAPVSIVNGSARGRLEAAARGRNAKGTHIKAA